MPLSVGLEFEFVATALVGGGPLPGHDDPARQLESIAGPLRKEGFAVDIHPDPNPSDLNYERWNVMFDKSIQLGASRITRLSPMPRFGFQLITPAFKKVTDSDWATTIEGAINVVGKAITIETNESTGLHVHVGQHKEFTVPEIKKILLLVCKYEMAIDAHYHKEHRITGNEFTASNIWNSQLKQFDVHSDVYNHIRQVKTVDGLLNLANPPKHPAGDESRRYYHVNFMSLEEEGKKTIEFREHHGTTDIQTALGWAIFVLRLVTYAVESKGDRELVRGKCTIENLNQRLKKKLVDVWLE